MNTKGKDLTKEAPASPRKRIHNYVILARLADKARAKFLHGNVGSYHTDCPLDNMLLGWKGIKYEEIKSQIMGGASDDVLGAYLDSHGLPKTAEEVVAWSDGMEKVNPYNDPGKKDWYAGEVKKLGLSPESTPLFAWLEADDKASF